MLFPKYRKCIARCVLLASCLTVGNGLALAQSTVRKERVSSGVTSGQNRAESKAEHTATRLRPNSSHNYQTSPASRVRSQHTTKRPNAKVRTASAGTEHDAVTIGESAIAIDGNSPSQYHGPSSTSPSDGSYFVDESEVMQTLAPQACNDSSCAPVICLVDWSRADLWMGVAGFSGPTGFVTSGANTTGQVEGSFGFHEGINLGSSLPSLLCGQLGAQIGLRAVQANLDGSAASLDTRNQLFVTGGLFRRVDYGFQGGLVVDYLHDDWFYQADLLQLRGEISFLLTPCHDLGFRFTTNQQTEEVQAFLASGTSPVDVEISTMESYRFFYRYQFGECGRGLAEFHAGFTEDRDTLLGTQLVAPLQGQLGLQTSATYMIPHETASPSYASEAWNLGLAIVWTPGRSFGGARDYYRPLLDVADNGSMIGRLVR